MRGIADPHRHGFFVARQPVRGPFRQPPLAAEAVHDLQLVGTAGHRAQQPLAPRLRLFVITGMHRAQQRERRIAQPAVSVIPVALAADPLGQRRCRRGDDAAGRLIGERLERDDGAPHRFRPLAGRPAFCRPFRPEFFGHLQRFAGIHGGRRRLMRPRVSENERNGVAAGDDKFADRRHVLAAEMNGRAQHRHVRSGDGAKRAVLQAGDPRDDGAVAEPQYQLGTHLQFALRPDDQTHDLGMVAVERHEVDQRRRSLVGFELGLEDQRARPIAAGDARFFLRRHQPAAVLRRAEQRRKAGVRIEARPAQPVDRAVARHQRGALAVADQGIIFGLARHDAGIGVRKNRRRL